MVSSNYVCVCIYQWYKTYIKNIFHILLQLNVYLLLAYVIVCVPITEIVVDVINCDKEKEQLYLLSIENVYLLFKQQ